MPRAKCIRNCFNGPTMWEYRTDGGPNGDGIYDDIDPKSPIAKYFEFFDEKTNEAVANEAEAKDAERAEKVQTAREELKAKAKR